MLVRLSRENLASMHLLYIHSHEQELLKLVVRSWLIRVVCTHTRKQLPVILRYSPTH